MNKNHQAIREAKEQGYNVCVNGILTDPRDTVISLKLTKTQRYPIMHIDSLLNHKPFLILIHRFAAYCFYGEELFKPNTVVRHRNRNTLDISKENILLGTPVQNSQDIPLHIRRQNSIAANTKQGHTCLTEEQNIKLKEMYATNRYNYIDLAHIFNITEKSVIDKIKGRPKRKTS
jgi:hypothetical protein